MASVQPTPDGAEYSQSPDDAAAAPPQCARLEIEPAANGGFVAQCFTDSGSGDAPSYRAPQKYSVKDRAELDALLDKLFGAAPAAPTDDVDTESMAGGAQ